VRGPDGYRRALVLANDARGRAYARAARVRFEVAVRRAMSGQRRWYSRWYRPPRRLVPFADAIEEGLRADPVYVGAVSEMLRHLDVALRYARHDGHRGDAALPWLLRQLVVLLRPLMGDEAAMRRVAELVFHRAAGPRGLPPPWRTGNQRR
jgi:hypothetical protein